MTQIPVDTTGIAVGQTLVWDGAKLIPGPPAAAPKVGATRAALGSGAVDGQPGVVRIGDLTERFTWDAGGGRWVGDEHVVLSTTDSWALDLSRCPIAGFANAWAKFSGGVGWEIVGGRTALRSAVTLPAATIPIQDPLDTPAQFPAAGLVLIRDQLVSYTGVSGGAGAMNLTGASGGAGSFPALYTPVIPWATGLVGGGDPGGWGTTVTPLDRVGELWAAGFRLEERANAWLNGSCDLKSMDVAPFYLQYNLGEDMGSDTLFPSVNTAPIAGMLGPGLTLTGPAYDMAGYTSPGAHDRRRERGFEMRSAGWTAWAATAPSKRYLTPVLYGRMQTGAQDNGEVYGWTHRMRWVSP